MKKRTLLSLLGLMASIAMPIYAQDVEEDVALEDNQIVAETTGAEAVDANAVEDLDDSFSQLAEENPQLVEDLNA
jgi:hypothetical protein